MNKVLQGGLISLYGVVKATGLLNTHWGRRVFESAYFIYKARLEAGPIQLLRRWVRPGTVVIDVGANVGFFSLHFAAWVSEGGKVIALEPEAVNFAGLQGAVARAGFAAVVDMVQAAAADVSGDGFLELNPGHPGDHKLGSQGVPVSMTSLDDLLRVRGWPEVSLIKIDVQGAESRVLAGARKVLDKFRPVLFLEIEDQKLRRYGSSANDLLTFCADYGYAFHTRAGSDIGGPLDLDQALILGKKQGYIDLLLLPTETASRAKTTPSGVGCIQGAE